MLWQIFLTIFSGVYIYWLYERYQNCWKYLNRFAGPFALPIIGNVWMFGFSPDDHLRISRILMKKYQNTNFRIYLGPQPYVILQNAKDIEHVLSSTKINLITKADIYDFLRPWLGNGLLTSTGQNWVTHRKILTPSFHFTILQDFLHIINETTDHFTTLLEGFAEKEKPFDFQEVITRCTIDVICECAMGTSVNAVAGQPSPILKAMNDLAFVVQERTYSVLKRSDVLFKLFPEHRMHTDALTIMQTELKKIIETRQQLLKTHDLNSKRSEDAFGSKRPKMAFLDNLLTAEKDGRSLTFQEIYDEVSTFMFEGHDTTATAITFIIFSLSRHPNIQEKAFQEQQMLYGNDLKRNPTYQELQDMKYLELIIKEGLRMFPSVPFIGRGMTETIEINGQIFPKGTTLLIPIIALGENDNYYAQPYEFRPERFDTAETEENINNFINIPFSAGPRNCIGQKFAMMELKVTISKIIRNFHILPAVDGLKVVKSDPNDSNNTYGPYEPRLAAPVTLKSLNGVYIRLELRAY